ncbi:DNA repair and recombination protein rad5c [Apiospora arundinis]|uniref:DNA repair and recombination protein rad5c n=1 Tax=Apiospora arundinis TaxID=335852 RepID=A0ABR2IRB3_9PEZI
MAQPFPYSDATGNDDESVLNIWAGLWGEMELPDVDFMMFPGDELQKGYGDFEDSWMNMQEWADNSFQPEPGQGAAIEDIVSETRAAGGSRFCCYGSVADVPIKLVGNMSDLTSKVNFPTKAFLLSIESVEVRAFASTASIQNVVERANKPGEAKLKVDINIYGSIEDAELVGERLSTTKVYLQDPDQGMQDIEYLNPHVLHFAGIEEPVAAEAGPTLTAGAQRKVPLEREQRATLPETVATLYQSLTRFRHLERTQGGPQVTTKLLAHQETALSFMLQREYGPIPSEYSLWAHERNVHTSLYRHKLTQAESLDPPDELGCGILADDPGMGKSLSTLALITATLAKAQAWSQEPTPESRKNRTKATLVIVPSTCNPSHCTSACLDQR